MIALPTGGKVTPRPILTLKDAERAHIAAVMERYPHESVKGLAYRLGVALETMRRKLRVYGLTRRSHRGGRRSHANL